MTVSLADDDDAVELWKAVGAPADRILRFGDKDNFWAMGETGPCGPCSEVHYFFGKGTPDVATFGQEPTEDGTGWVELWNLVFMQFVRDASRSSPAPVSMDGAGSDRVPPDASRTYCMKTRFQISRKRSHSQSTPQSGEPHPKAAPRSM